MSLLFFRCSLFLVDREREELVAKVFDGETTKDDEVLRLPSLSLYDSSKENIFNKSAEVCLRSH